MIKKILLALCLLCSAVQVNGIEIELKEFKKPHGLGYRVTRNDYKFSSVFELFSKKKLIASVIKSSFRVRTHYDLYNDFGAYKGQGICRVFCLGTFYAWGTEIDVYDEDGIKVGVIDGQFVTSEHAKFSIYGRDGTRIGIAYLEKNCAAFSIVDPRNEARLLVHLGRNFIENTTDYWDVKVYNTTAIDPVIIQIFAAFACDTQSKFKIDK